MTDGSLPLSVFRAEPLVHQHEPLAAVIAFLVVEPLGAAVAQHGA